MLAGRDAGGGQRPSFTLMFLLYAVVAGSAGFILAPVSFSQPALATSGTRWLAGVKALHVDACGRCFLPGGMYMASVVPSPLECRGKP
jgi:hypothetical protein